MPNSADQRDKYGIPEGGNNGAWSARYWQGLTYQLTWLETVAVVALGGWPEDKWAEAAATVAAESNRQPWIYNTYKQGHFGLFQISRSAHPEFFTPAGEGAQWMSPMLNAKEGYAIYRSQGWGAWEAHTKGTHKVHLPAARVAVAQLKKKGSTEAAWNAAIRPKTLETMMGAVIAANKGASGGGLLDGLGNAIVGGAEGTAGGVVAAGDAVVDTVGGMAQVVTGAWEALTTPALWMRLGYGVLGVVLVAGGLFLVVRNTAVQTAANTAGKALKGATQ